MSYVPIPIKSTAPTERHGPTPPRDCTFHPDDWAILSRFWYPLAFSSDVGDKPLAVRLLDERLVVYRAAGRLVVAKDMCAHRGVPLSLGWVEGENIVCPYHGLSYGPDGKCNKIPSQPDGHISEKLKICTYPAEERYGLIWTSLAGGYEPFPVMPTWDDPDFQQILPPSIDIGASAGRQVEGFIDVAHFAWIHEATFADRSNPFVPQYTAERTDTGMHAEYVSSVSNFPKRMQHRAPADFLWRRVFDIELPFTARLTVDFPEGGKLQILNAACPVSARETRLFVPITRNFDKDQPLQEVYDFNRQIFEEDRAIVETQRPDDLPLDKGTEAHILADRSSGAYRRAMSLLGLGAAYSA